MFTFFVFPPEIPFWANLVQNSKLSVWAEIWTYTNLKILNSMVVFTFSVLDQRNSFLGNLVQKIKIVSLNWNLVLRLIRIWGIQGWCSLFLFLPINTLLGQIWFKNSKLFFFIVKFDTKTNSDMPKSMVVSILSALDWK